MNESPTDERADSRNGPGSDRPVRSETSISATDYYDDWANQYVLSLDGGGVKGYSSLLILDRLMKYVELEEQRLGRETLETPSSTSDQFYFGSQGDSQTALSNSQSSAQGSQEALSGVKQATSQENRRTGGHTGLSNGHGSQAAPFVRAQASDLENGWKGGQLIDVPNSQQNGPDPKWTNYEEVDIDKVVPRDPPSLYFDYIFGTSTGGLIAIMLGRLRMTVADALKAYQDLAGAIFSQQQWGSMYGLGRYLYDHRKLEEAIKIVVRKQIETEEPSNEWRPESEQRIAGGAFNREPAFHSAPTKCRTVCVAYTDVESQMNKPFLFRSYEHLPSDHFWTIDRDTKLPTHDHTNRTAILQTFENDLNTGPAHALPIWQVARATSAAPPYFEPMVIDGETFIDGAVGCNNPARIAYREVALMHNGNRACIKLLLSIGTGVPEVKPMGRGRFAMMLQLVKWATGALTETESTHEMLSELSANDGGPGWYHRFNVGKQLGAMSMDMWTPYESPQSPGTQRRIEKLTAEYLRDPVHIAGLKKVAQQLAEVKRRRMQTKHWPMSASNERYRCMVGGCDNGQKVRNTRELLEQHIKKDHAKFAEDKQIFERILNSGKILH